MFSCSTCMERYLQGLVAKPGVSSFSIRTTLATTVGSAQLSRRCISNGAEPRTRQNVPRLADRLLETGGVPLRRRDYKLEVSMGNVLRKHPEYANDPLKLAEYTRKALRGDDFETAIAVVRAASKSLSCTVSWNHLIDWQMTKGKMNAALKTFNEMKKRGQQPDNHTFTIIIQGCTEHRDLSAAMGKVMTIFTAMSTEKSLVKPNIIHLNAIIKMCARARNMDTMYGFLAQMPKKGPGAPNNMTYTTVLNAIRTNALIDFRGDLTAVQKRQNAQKAILESRQMWQDITSRWRKGDIWIDEELVCAMGRILSFGDKYDMDDILSLIEQTMNIPRQFPKLHSPDRSDTEPFILSDVAGSAIAPAAPVATTSIADEETEESIIAAMRGAQVNSSTSSPPQSAPMPSPSAYAKPGNNTLTLLMDIFVKMSMKLPAYKYWNIITKEFGVEPDMPSCHGYLRVLRVSRGSTETVEFLQHIRGKELRSATFRIAMATCSRDKNNLHAFSNAGKILDIMTDTQQTLDIPVLKNYLEVALENTSHLSKHETGKQILRALERLGPAVINIKSLLKFGPPGQKAMTQVEQREYQDQVIQFARTMVGAYDRLMDQDLVERNTFSKYTAERSKLAVFAQRREYDWTKVDNQDFKLSTELVEYVQRHHLHKTMVRSQGSPPRWQEFVESLRRGIKKEERLAKDAESMRNESAEAEAAEKAAEDEKKFADIMATQMNLKR